MYLKRLKDVSQKTSLLRCYQEVFEMSLSMRSDWDISETSYANWELWRSRVMLIPFKQLIAQWLQASIRYRLSNTSELTIRHFSKIRQGSKISDLWETRRSPIFDSNWKKEHIWRFQLSPFEQETPDFATRFRRLPIFSWSPDFTTILSINEIVTYHFLVFFSFAEFF